jgi:hypothetical protein
MGMQIRRGLGGEFAGESTINNAGSSRHVFWLDRNPP